MSFFRRMARGRSDTTPARTLGSVATVIVIAVAVLIVLVFVIQSAF